MLTGDYLSPFGYMHDGHPRKLITVPSAGRFLEIISSFFEVRSKVVIFHTAGPVPITPAFYIKESKFSIGV